MSESLRPWSLRIAGPQPVLKIGKAERTRAEILDAAAPFLWSHPFREMTVGRVMASAGSNAAPFRPGSASVAALASYNAGYGHVLDARALALTIGKDRNTWLQHVDQAIVLLEDPGYHQKARYGYCRGSEPQTYVRNIQNTYSDWVPAEGIARPASRPGRRAPAALPVRAGFAAE